MDIYKKLALKLDSLPEGFPPTTTGVELQILEKLFTPDEALISCELNEDFQNVGEIAQSLEMDSKTVKKNLRQMGKKRIVAWKMDRGSVLYRLEPFVVGFYEGQNDTIDYELAHLVEHYFQEGGTVGIMKISPALQRVIPAHGSVEKETIMPYEDILHQLDSCKTFLVYDCVCRKQQELIGKKTCDFPLNVCMAILEDDIPGMSNRISYDEAKALISRCEDDGLIHTVRNVVNGVNYICNCCSCCCGILRGITEYGIENSIARSNYFAVVKEEMCTGCGVCKDRCQMDAIEVDFSAVIDLKKCIGCGLCVTTCPTEAMSMFLKGEKERPPIPEGKKEWDDQRQKNRQTHNA
jgi:H+/Na+-translocating ferredoxin:NAD+ oxidoreductase subunit B